MLPHMADCVAKLGNLFGRGFPSAGDEGETVDVLGFIILCLSETFFSGEEVIDFGLRLVVGGLCAPFTIFRASARFSVDDGTQVELVRSTRDGNLMCGGVSASLSAMLASQAACSGDISMPASTWSLIS